MPQYNLPEKAMTPPVEFIYNESAWKIHSIDPTATLLNRYYPGLRGTNQLIVYTPEFGLRTGTNEFKSVAVGSIL